MKFKFWHLWIFIGAFMGYILFLVFSAVNQNVDLETEQYYEEEVAYQDVIDKKQNYKELDETINLFANERGFLLSFPSSFLPSLVTGKVKFRCNVDAGHDFDVAIKLDESGNMLVNSQEFGVKGYYKVKVDWEYQDKKYFTEQEVRIE